MTGQRGLRRKFAILEYDSSPHGIVQPSHVVKSIDVSPHCVLCFFHEVIQELVVAGVAKQIHALESTAGPQPVYEILNGDRRVTVIHPGVGAPMAALTLEKALALGCRKFIAVGGAGVLDGRAEVGRIIVPNAAVRDEGTSFHYMAPSREVGPSPKAVAAIESTLREVGLDYLLGKTWTTDAFFRETPARVALRKQEGCLTVEMEASALFAVACHRQVVLGQILYAGDVVRADKTWDPRNWQHASCRGRLLWLAIRACLLL